MKKGNVYLHDEPAGEIWQDENGYHFRYLPGYLQTEGREPISLTLPITEDTYQSNTLFPFFDGLIPEGWLLTIAEQNWKLNPKDRMELLLVCCKDCIGAVSIQPVNDEEV